ncbi:MAG TPA: YbhB/YbcL family Raf kinase inhibitor-like protein [Ktedonobacteraceae bacterium]|nr:YbhB/YbcL family Raf kinase inhibitor-like protein [Ktedonobacteraceae bacterium]
MREEEKRMQRRAETLGQTRTFTLSSPDFQNNGMMSEKLAGNSHNCHGENQAPTLNWSNPPANTRSFALTVVDPDAPVRGGFHHWLVYNIPASVHSLQGNTPYTEGTTSANTRGYTGPCPPPGQTHHYIFTLYALDIERIPYEGLPYSSLMQAIEGHVLGSTLLVGLYRRQS